MPTSNDRDATRYRIQGRIGRGAFGEVVEASDELLGRRVAIKRLPAASTIPVLARRALLGEARMASAAGRAAVQVFDIVDVQHESWLVMELIEGGSLADRLRKGIEGQAALGLAIASAERLSELHGLGIVHGDIHPGNILLRAEDDVAYSDFGLARVLGKAGAQNRSDRRARSSMRADVDALTRALRTMASHVTGAVPSRLRTTLAAGTAGAVTDARTLASLLQGDRPPTQAPNRAMEPNLEAAARAAREGRLDAARTMLIAAIRAAPTDPDARRRLAYVHWMAGDQYAAIWELEAACRLAPTDGQSRTVLQNWRSIAEGPGL